MTLENKVKTCMVKECGAPATDGMVLKISGEHFITILLCTAHSENATIETYTVRTEVMRWKKA